MNPRWTRRDFVRHGAIAAGAAVWCGAADSLAAMGGKAMVTPEAEILAQVNAARPLRGGLVPRYIARRLGTAHVGGRYHFTERPFLIVGAERVCSLGLGGIKLWFGNVELGYSFNSDWELSPFYTFKELAQHPYFVAAFDLPFDVIALEVYAARPPQTAGGAGSDLLDPRYDCSVDETQIYDLTRHLGLSRELNAATGRLSILVTL